MKDYFRKKLRFAPGRGVLAGIGTSYVELVPEVMVMTDQEQQMIQLMADQTRAKAAGNIDRYQELQTRIEALAEEMGWVPHLVREGPFGI